MYCLANICYVCLEKDKLLSNINCSLSENKDLIHIIEHLPFNLACLKTLRIILICDECCLRLRETFQFLEKCLKSNALLQTYVDKLNTTSISDTENESELLWQPNIEKIGDVFVDFEDSLVKEGIIDKNGVLDDKQEYPTEIIEEDVPVDFEDSLMKEGTVCKKEVDDMQDNNSTEIIEETEGVFVNLEDYFVKDENSWKREAVDNVEECPMDNSSTENIANVSDSEISVNDNAHLTNADCASSGSTCKQAHARNKNDLHAAAKNLYKCSSCSKSFITKSKLNRHSQIHTDIKSYECTICKKRFRQKVNLGTHIKVVHTGEKSYNCTRCKKCFSVKSNLVRRMRKHTGEKPYECSICTKCFTGRSQLVCHLRIHTGEKPCNCTRCKRDFRLQVNLVRHMHIHNGEKPFECTSCKKCFIVCSKLVRHVRIHTGEKPYECSRCKKCFSVKSSLVRHMRLHTSEKP